METMKATETQTPDGAVTGIKVFANRSILVDVVRGLAISLVALGHTDEGTEHRDWWGTSHVGYQLEMFIYAFHMPAFFFVSGIFLSSSVAKRGPRKFVTTKVAQMLYPWLLWSVIQYAQSFPLHRFIEAPIPPFRLFLAYLYTGSTFWFLPAIFCCVVLGMLLRKVNKPLLFLLALVAALLPPPTSITVINATMSHFVFLVAGMWLGVEFDRLERISWPWAALGALLVGGLVYVETSSRYLGNRWLLVPVGLAGTAMLFLLARCLGKRPFARFMAWVGEASFGVYLMSQYGQGLGRELLLRGLHVTEPYLQLIIPTVVAIAIPAWLYQHRVRLKMGWLFTWPFGAV